ncbi:MAG: hypothetical protein IPH69_15240 [Bacteroidales bacterium]|nr:hypothetical protein [Bacteroidales bacterium]
MLIRVFRGKKNYKICNKYNAAITIIVIDETPIGNQTGAIQGTGMRNRTSIVLKDGGHFIRI